MLAASDNDLYILALTAGFAVVLAYGMLLLFTIDIKSPERASYNRSKKIFGTTLTIWAIHILLHALFNTRYTNNYLAISISLSSYYMLATGFEMTLHTLLDNNYFSLRRVRSAILNCLLYCAVIAIDYLYIPATMQHWSIFVLSIPLIIKMVMTAYRSTKRYQDVKHNIDNYYSDNTSEAVTWMQTSIYIMIGLGVSSLLISYGTALTDSIMMIIALVALTYLMISMRNYLMAITSIQKHIDEISEKVVNSDEYRRQTISDIKVQILKKSLEEWVETHRFIDAGITIDDVAKDIHSNRRYISEYLNQHLNQTFKSWIALLKIEYSKTLLLEHPTYTSNKIAEMIGYSRSNYNKAFAKIVGDSPNNWRRDNLK